MVSTNLTNRSIIINFFLLKFKYILLNWKSYLFIIIIILIAFLDNKGLKGHFSSINNWDLFFSILNNQYYQLFLFVPFYLVIVFEVCNDKPVYNFLLLRLRTKKNWLYSKYIGIIFLGSLFTLVYIVLLLVISSILNVFNTGWSPSTIFLWHGNYSSYLSPLEALFVISIRYLLSTWLVGFLYLFVYLISKTSKNVRAIFINIILLILNKIFNVNFFMSFIPFIHIDSRYIIAVKNFENAFYFTFYFNFSIICFILLLFFSINFLKQKNEFLG